MPSSRTKMKPRWEWRTFADSLAWLEAKIGLSVQIERKQSREIYLLHSKSPHSAKIRNRRLDVKRLVVANLPLQFGEIRQKTNIMDHFRRGASARIVKSHAVSADFNATMFGCSIR